jgi:hypothetical protein
VRRHQKPDPEEVARKWLPVLGAFAAASGPLTYQDLPPVKSQAETVEQLWSLWNAIADLASGLDLIHADGRDEAVSDLENAKLISWIGDWRNPKRYVVTDKGRLALSHVTEHADPVMVERLERDVYGRRGALRLHK